MRVATSALMILCVALTIEACKCGPSTAKSAPTEPAADPSCVPPKNMPWEIQGVPVARVIEQLSSPHAKARANAAYWLREYGCAAAPATPALTRALKDPSDDVRYRAAETLGTLGPRASSAAPELINLLEKNPGGKWSDRNFLQFPDSTPSWCGRWMVAKALAALGPEAVRQTLTRIIRKNYSEDGQKITIKAFLTEWSTVVPGLLRCLQDRKDPELRLVSAEMLGAMDTEVESATPGLFVQMVKGLARALLEDPEPEVRARSAYAFQMLQRGVDNDTPVGHLIRDGKEPMPAVVRALVKALGDPNAKVRRAVVVALEHSYTADKALALPALERARKDRNKEVSSRVRDALKSIREFEELERKRREEYRNSEYGP